MRSTALTILSMAGATVVWVLIQSSKMLHDDCFIKEYHGFKIDSINWYYQFWSRSSNRKTIVRWCCAWDLLECVRLTIRTTLVYVNRTKIYGVIPPSQSPSKLSMSYMCSRAREPDPIFFAQYGEVWPITKCAWALTELHWDLVCSVQYN